MNKAFGPETRYVTTIGLSQIAGAQLLHVHRPRHWINCGQAGPLGWTIPAALGVAKADPDAQVVALSGDYDFQFMIEELAVGAQQTSTSRSAWSSRTSTRRSWASTASTM